MKSLRTLLKSLPIAKKLALTCFVASFISLLAAMTAIFIYDKDQLESITENELTILASVISNRSSAAIIFDDGELATQNLQTLSHQKSVVAACIYKTGNDSSIVLAQYPSDEILCPNIRSENIKFLENNDADFKELIHPIILDDIIIAYLYIKSNTEELKQLGKNHLFVFSIISGIVLLITLAFSLILSLWITRPLSSLRDTAQQIASNDDYSLRATKFHSDEVGEVVESFNQMLSVIEYEDKKLRESEEKFRLISAYSKVGIFQLDTSGNFVFANEELSEITALENETLMKDSWFSVIHPEDRPIVEAKWKGMIYGEQDVFISCRLMNPEIKWIDCSIGLLHSIDGSLIGYLGTIHDTTAVKTAQNQLEKMAFYDTLTGLANRRLFRNRLEHALGNLTRGKTKLGLVLLDLDNFKDINDSLGHDAGDKLLSLVSKRLQDSVRTTDTVSRLGGDEFAIILPGISNPLDISTIVEGVLDSLREHVNINGSQIRVTASAGVTMSPDDGTSTEVLIKNADLALYQAKYSGRNQLQFFTKEMNTKLLNYLGLKEELHRAVDRQDFTLVFQPQIGLATNSLTGFEALIRWNHDSRGFISPVDFIPAAEDTGLIIPMGRWVIDTACAQFQNLRQKGLIGSDVVMTVNLSVKQFQDESLVEFLEEKLREYEVMPNQFEIEVTESLLMENIDKAIAKLIQFKNIGILISIDDFGTGYSSLGYLKRLPVDIVKVDRSFVMDIPQDKDDMEITAAVIAMAHGLNYKVVAEGVETMEQLEFLNKKGCDYGQGYLFSRPLAQKELEDYCRRFPEENFRQVAK